MEVIPQRTAGGRKTGLLTGLAAVLLAGGLCLGCSNGFERVSARPQRIIAVAPNVVEILFELGLGDRVVGVGSHCFYPPEAAAKPKIGGLLDPRLELIVRLQPDLAIVLPSEEGLARALEGLGIEVMVTAVETLEDIARAMQEIGDRVGEASAAREAVARLERSLDWREGAELSALLVVGREPGTLSEIYAASRGTFLDELLVRAGGVNVLADAPSRYPVVGLEEILVRAPQVILELQPSALGPDARKRLVADWAENMSASPPCVAILEGDHVLVPGPRVGSLYADLADGLADCRGSGV